jgi:bifunctional non-homologous end joining protein LigD
MKECVWVKPRIVAEVEFLEWTGADHLRHTKFVCLRDDKDPRLVVREP